MNINLEGLTPIADITIGVSSNADCIKIYPNDWNSPAIQAIQALNGQNNITVSAVKLLGCIAVYPGNYDVYALAERIATECEMQKLAVRRLVSDPKSHDRSPKIPTQSFLF